jgi:hypothetical protein
MAANPSIPTLCNRNAASLNVESLATRLPEIGSLKPPCGQNNLPWIQWQDIYTESDSSGDQLRAWIVYLVYLREAIHWDADDHQEMRQYLAVRRLYRLKGLDRLAPSRTLQYCAANTREENYTLSIGHLLKTLYPIHPVVEFWALHRRVYPGVPAGVSRSKDSAETTGPTANPIELGFDGLDAEASLASRSRHIGIDSYLKEIPTHLTSEETAFCGSSSTLISMNSDQHVQDSNLLTCGMIWRISEEERTTDITNSDVTMTGINHAIVQTSLSSQTHHRCETFPKSECHCPARVFGKPTEQLQNESIECDLSTSILDKKAFSNTGFGSDQTKRSTETHGGVSNHSARPGLTSDNLVTSLSKYLADHPRCSSRNSTKSLPYQWERGAGLKQF